MKHKQIFQANHGWDKARDDDGREKLSWGVGRAAQQLCKAKALANELRILGSLYEYESVRGRRREGGE